MKTFSSKITAVALVFGAIGGLAVYSGLVMGLGGGWVLTGANTGYVLPYCLVGALVVALGLIGLHSLAGLKVVTLIWIGLASVLVLFLYHFVMTAKVAVV
jgi:hypothetical protein